MNKCFEEVNGFQELVESGDLKICFLHDPEFGYTGNPKAPEGRTQKMLDELCFEYLVQNGVSSFEELGEKEANFKQSVNGKYNYRSVEEANLPININRNIGITFPSDSDTFDEKWVCLDIDGQDSAYMVEKSEDLKIATRYYLFQCVKEGLKKRGIKFVCNTTMNKGFHIYFKTKKTKFKDHDLSICAYPKSMEAFLKVDSDIFNKFPHLNSIIGKANSKGIIEVFTKGKYVVAPGSIIDGRKYELLNDGVQDFREVSVYEDGFVEDLISEILIDDYFFEKKVEDAHTQNGFAADSFKPKMTENKQNLTKTNIKNIGDFILYAFQHISGQKHHATLALGGFLYSQNISQESILDLGEYIIDHAPNDLFKNSKEVERTNGFLKVLMHDSVEDEEKKKTGLNTLKEIFKDTEVPLRELTKILWTNSSPSFHTFQPNGINAESYKEITIDFDNKETRSYTIKMAKGDDDDYYPKKMTSHLIKHVLTDINYIDDISGSKLSKEEQMPISFYIQSRLKPARLYICENTYEMIDHYDAIPLAHQKGSNEILAMVIDEYESIGLIGMIESSTIPGVYLSRDGKDLRRFILKEGEIVEVSPSLPNAERLKEALILLKQINDAYPWYEDKFATFVKLGMILPYGYVFKSEYSSFIRGIILYGEGGTCKSSASELIIRMNVPTESIDEAELNYILPGSEFSTVYRMGKTLDAHSYPVMIEEVESVFEDADNRDLIKNSITRKFIRNPGGEKEYYSRAIPVFSANELNDEIEKSGMFRRFLILNFVNGERGDKPEVEEALSFLNTNGVRNSRFRELYIISEFIFHDLHEHLEYFAYSPQEIIDTILKDMSDYTKMDLSWLIEPNFDKYYQTDRSAEDQTDFSMILDTLKYHFKNSIKMSGVASNVSEQFLENLIEDKYSYIFRMKNRQTNGVLITSDFNKSYKKVYPEAKKISIERLEELLNENLELKETVKKAKMKPNNLKKRVTGLYMDWEDFCSIFNIRNNSGDE